MAYDSYNYDIKDKMPEWWKEDTILEPINRYSQQLIRDLVGGLLENIGVVQPVQVWKTLPTEYSWTHTYTEYDDRIRNQSDGLSSLTLTPGNPLKAYVPNSKRKCHAVIQIQLKGNDNSISEHLDKLILRNNNQTITISNIKTSSDIRIITETNTILIDGVSKPNLIKGSFNKIHPQAENTNFNEVDIYNENKTTFIEIEASKTVDFSLQIKLIHPVYVTEQNIRLHTLSAFPLEWVKLYGFFCHDFNNKQEWKFLWEKQYKEEDRVVYDRITKQFDCETFYVQVKLHGIGMPLVYGFPQEEFAINPAFQTNYNLDKWGRIYGMPRRFYKTRITEDEEPYTYPPFYNYDIEQDYWFEQRLINEYRYNAEAINATFIKDSDLNNIAVLKCIDPFMHDLYVYTETISKDPDKKHQTNEIYPVLLSEDGDGVTWQRPHYIENNVTTATEVILQPNNSESFNTKENQTKVLKIFFDVPELPKNIKIKGLELFLNGFTDLHSDSLILDDRSQLLLPVLSDGVLTDQIDPIPINNEPQYWEKGQSTHKIGGPTDLFNLQEIKKEQIENGITFKVGFTNLNEFLKATIVLYSIKLIVHYETIEGSYSMTVDMSDKEIVLSDPDKQSISMQINFENTGEIPVTNKNVYISIAKGLDITNQNFQTFDLDVDERGDNKFIIGKRSSDEITITPTTYEYKALEEGTIITKELNANKEFNIIYKGNEFAKINIYCNNEKIKEIEVEHNTWEKFKYYPVNQNNNELLEFKVEIENGSILLKNPSDDEGNLYWEDLSEFNTIEQQRTGVYDVVVFCDDKVIKNEIIVKEGYNNVIE